MEKQSTVDSFHIRFAPCAIVRGFETLLGKKEQQASDIKMTHNKASTMKKKRATSLFFCFVLIPLAKFELGIWYLVDVSKRRCQTRKHTTRSN